MCGQLHLYLNTKEVLQCRDCSIPFKTMFFVKILRFPGIRVDFLRKSFVFPGIPKSWVFLASVVPFGFPMSGDI